MQSVQDRRGLRGSLSGSLVRLLLVSTAGAVGSAVPAQPRGYIHGTVAFLRTDPSAARVAFPVIAGERYRTIVLADGRGSSLVPSRPVDNSNWKPLA